MKQIFLSFILISTQQSSERSQNDIHNTSCDSSLPSTNFSSILNVPQRSQGIFNSLFSILQETILEKPFFLNFRKQNTLITPQLTLSQAQNIVELQNQQFNLENILNVDSREFINYIRTVGPHLQEYLRIQVTSQQLPINIDLDALALDCYQNVPSIYFDTNFHFNFESLVQSKEQINETQEQLSTYLDEVDMNLFYQINSRFDQFLSVILNLNEMNGLLEENLQKVTSLRQSYHVAKNQLLKKAKAIIHKKKQIDQMENALQLLKLMQTTQRSITSMQDMIKQQKYESTTRLLKVTESTYNQNLKSIACLKEFPSKLLSMNDSLQKQLINHIVDFYLNQLKSQLTPFKKEEDLGNSSFFMQNDSWFDISNNSGVVNSQKDLATLSKLLQQANGIVDLTSRLFKNKILDELKSYYDDFILGIQEGDEDIYERMSLSWFTKMVIFLSDNFKKAIMTQVAMANVSQVIQNNNAAIEECYMIVVAMFKFVNEKLAGFMTYKNVVGPIKEFKEYLQVFNNWSKFFNGEFQNAMERNFQKCSINQLNYVRQEQEMNYMKWFQKQKMDTLKQKLEDEMWAPADINFDNYEVIYYLLNLEKLEEQPTLQVESMLDESVFLNNSVTKGGQFSVLQQLINNQVFKIVKTEILMLKDQQKFRVTNAFIVFMQSIYEYFQLFEGVDKVRMDWFNNLTELMNFYNSYSTQLILGAGAISFGKMKTIAARNLAISSQCLQFLLQLYEPIKTRLQKIFKIDQEFEKVRQDYQNHNLEILEKITNLLQTKYKEQCDELGKQNWNDHTSKLTTPSKYTAQILNSTRQLYIAIEEQLFQNDLIIVFNKIIESLSEQYISTFKNLNITSKQFRLGATRVKEELEYLRQQLLEIGQLGVLIKDQLNKLENDLNEIIDNKCKNLLQE